MADSPQIPLLPVTEHELQKIRNSFGIDDADMLQEKLGAIKKWCERQAHLVEGCQHINSNVLEHSLLLAKGSVELAKIKIDKLLTTRGMVPELIVDKSYEEFEKILENVIIVPLPKLNPTNQLRCTVLKVLHPKIDDETLLSLIRFCFMSLTVISPDDWRIQTFYDHSRSDIYVLDLKNVTASILTKINPILLKKAEILGMDAFGYKIKEIYFLNASSFVDKFLSLIRPFIKKKIMSRVRVINSYEDLHKYIPKNILPADFGGDEPSLATLLEQWKFFLRTNEARKLISNSYKVVSDESKRSCFKFNEEYFGMPGSFRQLTLD